MSFVPEISSYMTERSTSTQVYSGHTVSREKVTSWIQPARHGSRDQNASSLRRFTMTTSRTVPELQSDARSSSRLYLPTSESTKVPSQIALATQGSVYPRIGGGSQIDFIRRISSLQARSLSPSPSPTATSSGDKTGSISPSVRQGAHGTLPRPPACAHDISSTNSSMTQIDPEVKILAAELEKIFADREKYKQLLSCPKPSAQKLLDMFQRLLDLLGPYRPKFRGDLIVATQRLAGKSGLYPVSFELKNITAVGEFSVSNGAFADIYKGVLQNRSVCLKTIRLFQKTDTQQFLKACSKEAILWSQLSHPNLLPFYGIYRFRNQLSLVSPWMEHGNITNFLQNYPSANRVYLALDVAQGLKFLHDNGIIHGDLKGPNILVNELKRACLADFGLSSISDPEILAWTTQSSAASTGGSVRWQAPELFDPESDEDVHNTIFSDVYAWACVAYEIFTGQIPFSHLSRDSAVSLKVRNGGRPLRPEDSSLSWTAWGLTGDIWTLMEDGWKADPASRPTVERIVERLEYEMGKKPASANETDTNAKWVENTLSAARFRALACEGSDVVDVSSRTLEMLLNAK